MGIIQELNQRGMSVEQTNQFYRGYLTTPVGKMISPENSCDEGNASTVSTLSTAIRLPSCRAATTKSTSLPAQSMMGSYPTSMRPRSR
jgi:hypothetical protein